jgi:glycosyltransferase involved in cell wall biosynthesis
MNNLLVPSKLHILQSLILYPPDSFGGTEQYVHGLAHDLQTEGCQVTVSATAGHEFSYVHDGISVYRYPSVLKPSRAEMRGEVPPLQFEVFERWLRHAHVDVMHMHALSRATSLYHAKLCKALGIPLVFTVHLPEVVCARGTMMHQGREACDGKVMPHRCASCKLQALGMPTTLSYITGTLPLSIAHRAADFPGRLGTVLGMPALIANRSFRMHQLFALADRIVVVAQWLYDVLIRNGVDSKKIVLSRHGLAAHQMVARRVRELHQNSPLTIGFVGRFNHIKGAHILIEAVMRLPAEMPVQLQIYGVCNDPMEEAYLTSLKQQAVTDTRISFPGKITIENRAQVFDAFDVLAVPSQCLETGPLVVLEAFAAGIPVVGSNLGGMIELVSPGVNGLLVPHAEPQAWTFAFTRLLQEDRLLTRLSQATPQVRTSKLVATEMLALYHELIPTL